MKPPLKRYHPCGFTALESMVMLILLTVFTMVTLAVVKKGVSQVENTPTDTAHAEAVEAAPEKKPLPDDKPMSPPAPTPKTPPPSLPPSTGAGTAGSESSVLARPEVDAAK